MWIDQTKLTKKYIHVVGHVLHFRSVMLLVVLSMLGGI